MEERAQPADRLISELAGRQHGLVTRTQLLGAGLTAGQVRWRVRTGRIEPVQRGVYRVGPVASPRARLMAAVLACGPEAVLSHWSGGGLWQVYPDRGSSGPVDVTVPFGTHRARPGVRLHRVRVLPPEEVTHLDGIPVTTLARTILDLASVLSSSELRRVLAVALSEHSMEREQLTELVVRYPGRRGVPVLRALLKDDTPPALTVSKAEQRFLRLITRARLAAPEVNAWFEGYKVDFLWRTHRLIVEVDGFAFHGSRERFENDRRRDGELTARGFRVMRVTWRQITQEPEVVLVQVAQALAIA